MCLCRGEKDGNQSAKHHWISLQDTGSGAHVGMFQPMFWLRQPTIYLWQFRGSAFYKMNLFSKIRRSRFLCQPEKRWGKTFLKVQRSDRSEDRQKLLHFRPTPTPTPHNVEQTCVVISIQKTAGFTKENPIERNRYFATSRKHICLSLQTKTMM